MRDIRSNLEFTRKQARCALLVMLVMLVSAAFATSASAGTVTLNFHSLPSAQGWETYTFGGATEASVYTIQDAQLHMDTMGLPYSNGGSSGGAGANYRLYDVVDDAPYLLRVMARVTAVEGDTSSSWFGGAFQFSVNTGSKSCAFAVTPDKIYYISSSSFNVVSTAFNNRVFHEYEVKGGGSSTCSLYVDGQFVTSQTARSTSISRLLLGDTTYPTNARAEVRSYIFLQDSSCM